MNSVLFLPRLNSASRVFYLHFYILHNSGLFIRSKKDNGRKEEKENKTKQKNMDFEL